MVRALWLRCKTRVSAELAEELLMLFFAWNVTQMLEAKRSDIDQVTHPFFN